MAFESKIKSEEVDELCDAILTLKDREDCYRFFTDICTINEIRAISQRLQVAKLLSEKKTYSEIEEITKASTATISRINKCLVYGADGYRLVLDRLAEEEKIGIVPEGVLPAYCGSWFPNEHIIDYMNLPSEDREKFLPFCTWYEERPAALVQHEDT